MKISKTTFIAMLCMLGILSVNAQIDGAILTTKSTKIKPLFPKADPVIKEIIDAADDGTYKFNMATLTLGKYQNTNKQYVGSASSSSVAVRLRSLTKIDELTGRCVFMEEQASNNISVFFISTTKLGGKKIKIKHMGRGDFRHLKNINIIKREAHSFLITADYENNGSITNYIFNIFRNVIQ